MSLYSEWNSLAFGGGHFVRLYTVQTSDAREPRVAAISIDGRTWEKISRDLSKWGQLLVYGGGRFIAFGIGGALTSTDGRTWQEEPTTAPSFLHRVIYAASTFVMVGELNNTAGSSGSHSYIFTSLDGLNWTRRVGTDLGAISGAIGDIGVMVVQNRYRYRGSIESHHLSTNGQLWQRIDVPEGMRDVAFGNGVFVAPCDAGFATSPDGVTWTTRPEAGTNWLSVRFSAGQFLALGVNEDSSKKIALSRDGAGWLQRRIDLEIDEFGIDAAYDGQTIVIVGTRERDVPLRSTNVILRSSNSGPWQEVLNRREAQWWWPRVAFGNGRFVALDPLDREGSLVSEDGFVWTKHPIPTTQGMNDLIFAAGRFYAIENNFIGQNEARLLSSADGVHWTIHRTGYYENIQKLAAGPQGLFAFGDVAVILQSPWDVTLKVLEQLRDGGLRIEINGYPGQQVVLESSPTLAPANWQPIATNTLANAATQFLDASATNATTRFYRAVTR